MTDKTKKIKSVTNIFISVIIALAVILCNLVLHEFGHCIAVWILGGKVTGFHIFSKMPNMTFDGIPENPLIDIFGSVFPLIIGIAAILILKKANIKSRIAVLSILAYGFFTTFSITAWICQPVKFILGQADPKNDVTKFINSTQFPPAAVTVTALAAAVLYYILCAKTAVKTLNTDEQFEKSKRININVIFPLTLVIIIVLQIFAPSSTVADGIFEFTANGSESSILRQNIDIDINGDGKYIFYSQWNVNREGVIAAVVLNDGDNVYFDCSAAQYADVESLEIPLKKGRYTLSVYSISSPEDWKQYCKITGTDPNDLDFEFSKNNQFTVKGTYSIKRK